MYFSFRFYPMLKLTRVSCLILLLPTLFAISSCSRFDPPVVVPAYGHIDSIHFSVPADSANKQGSASALIPYAWVYLDNNPVGTFELPCTFPMIASNGMHNISIYPGIIPAGVNSPAGINPFYQFYSFNVNIQQGSTYKFKPTSSYYNWVKFPYMESFDESPINGPPRYIINYHGGGNLSAASDTTMMVINKKGLAYHVNSGMVIVNATHNYYIGMTWPWDSLPTNGSTPVYMELNYRATAPFAIGLFESDTATQIQPAVIVYPSSTWTKMYVVFQPTLAVYSIQAYNIYFSMSYVAGDGSDTLLLDNIKILD